LHAKWNARDGVRKRERENVELTLYAKALLKTNRGTYLKVAITLFLVESIDESVERYKHRIRGRWALSGLMPQDYIFGNSTEES
jgi:hypothetical protein